MSYFLLLLLEMSKTCPRKWREIANQNKGSIMQEQGGTHSSVSCDCPCSTSRVTCVSQETETVFYLCKLEVLQTWQWIATKYASVCLNLKHSKGHFHCHFIHIGTYNFYVVFCLIVWLKISKCLMISVYFQLIQTRQRLCWLALTGLSWIRS